MGCTSTANLGGWAPAYEVTWASNAERQHARTASISSAPPHTLSTRGKQTRVRGIGTILIHPGGTDRQRHIPPLAGRAEQVCHDVAPDVEVPVDRPLEKMATGTTTPGGTGTHGRPGGRAWPPCGRRCGNRLPRPVAAPWLSRVLL